MNPNTNVGEPFSGVDAAWLHMDTPTNLAVINGVMTFNRPLDFDRLKVTVTARMLSYDRFTQACPRAGRSLWVCLYGSSTRFLIWIIISCEIVYRLQETMRFYKS